MTHLQISQRSLVKLGFVKKKKNIHDFVDRRQRQTKKRQDLATSNIAAPQPTRIDTRNQRQFRFFLLFMIFFLEHKKGARDDKELL